MANFVDNYWYLQYSSDITEEIFNKLILSLTSNGLKFREHCDFKLDYNTFIYYKYLRSPEGPGERDKYGMRSFSIDNNDQGIKNEISVNDILNLSLEPNYEIY